MTHRRRAAVTALSAALSAALLGGLVVTVAAPGTVPVRPAAAAALPALNSSAATCSAAYSARNYRGWRTGVLAIGDETLVAGGRAMAAYTTDPRVRLARPVCLRAQGGRTVADAVRVLRSATMPGTGFTVLIAAGAYDVSRPDLLASGVEQVMATATRGRQVLWVTPTARDLALARRASAVLAAAAARHPNLRLIGWQSYAARHPGLVGSDGRSLTAAGAPVWGRVVGAGVVGSGPHGNWAANTRVLSSTAQCQAAAGSARGVYLLGDSLTARSLPAFRTALAARSMPACLDIWPGRNTRPAAVMAAALPATPQTWLVTVAPNDVFPENTYHLAADIDRLMAAAGPARQVVWVEVHVVRRSTYPVFGPEDAFASRRINGLLAAAARRHPNLRVVPWWATAQATPTLLTDGVHLSSAGERVYIPRALDAVAAVQ